MKKLERIKELKEEIKDLEEQLNERQKDFIKQYDLLDIEYLEDAISNYADQNVSIYTSEQRDYFNNAPVHCTDALKELGYELKDFDDLDQAICKAGVCAEYLDIEGELYEDNRLEELQKLMKELMA